jgi:hypothetical protein
MTATYPKIHDRARALSNSRGISLTAAYSELAKRAGAAKAARNRRHQRVHGKMAVTAAATGVIDSSCQRQWLPYADL